MGIDLQAYAKLLVCPVCHGRLTVSGASFLCQARDCRRRYQMQDDIPVMLAEESQTLSVEDWSALLPRTESTVPS